MIHGIGIVARSLQVLIEITRFHICFFTKPVTHRHVQAVLIKPPAIYMATMRGVDEHFVL